MQVATLPNIWTVLCCSLVALGKYLASQLFIMAYTSNPVPLYASPLNATDQKPAPVTPRIILHGGAGNITRDNLPPNGPAYNAYRNALLSILSTANSALQKPGATALDIATYTVSLLENNSLFNSGHGAVYTTHGTHELEASVMVSKGYRKRGVGIMKSRRAKNPILLAKEMLIRGEENDGGGAGQHCQLHGDTVDMLSEQWGLDVVRPSYFWTKKRWDEHRRGLGLSHTDQEYEQAKLAADERTETADVENQKLHVQPLLESKLGCDDARSSDPSWDAKEYLPQGTVGCVVLDSFGTLCVATSTGGLTNKLPGRIGDTPTLGAGFWAEEWSTARPVPVEAHVQIDTTADLAALARECLHGLEAYLPFPSLTRNEPSKSSRQTRGVAMSGTGNGDSFLRVNAVRTAAAIARYSPSLHNSVGTFGLDDAVTMVAGPNGQLQRSAEDRWKKTGEGEGGIIGIDYQDGKGKIVADFNSGGMFRAWIDEVGKEHVAIFRDEFSR